jgi:hypothetical protein
MCRPSGAHLISGLVPSASALGYVVPSLTGLAAADAPIEFGLRAVERRKRVRHSALILDLVSDMARAARLRFCGVLGGERSIVAHLGLAGIYLLLRSGETGLERQGLRELRASFLAVIALG